MESVCYARKKNGELCNTKLTEKNKHEIKIENGMYFVCGRHKKINNVENIDISRYEITDKIDILDKKSDIINEFNEKLNINNDKKDKKKPCLQYIIYLISKDDNNICQFEDCQFTHNVNIVYTDD